MYYLLEDNRIVDRKNIRVDLDLPFEVDFYVQKDKIVLTINHIYFDHISIINKSENLSDFIDKKQDLVKVDGQIIMAKTILGNIRNFGISAIYKPDSQGNFIKVWEVKGK